MFDEAGKPEALEQTLPTRGDAEGFLASEEAQRVVVAMARVHNAPAVYVYGPDGILIWGTVVPTVIR